MTKLILSGIVVASLFLLILITNQRVSSSSVIEDERDERSSEFSRAESALSVESARSRYTLPRMFDFQRFKRVFKRVYNSILEEMARKRIFLARAFQAFVSAVFYKHGKRSSYLAINAMSDWTPEEVDRLYLDGDEVLTKLKATFHDLDFEDEHGIKEQKYGQNFIPAMDEEEIKENMEIISGNKDYKEIAEEFKNANKIGREKRSINSRSNLDMDDLFREPSSFATGAQMSEKVPSNNPNYVVPELRSFGEVERSGWASFMPSNLALQIMAIPGAGLANVANLIGSISSKIPPPSEPTTASPEVEKLEPRNDLSLPDDGKSDEIFIDHRGSNCLLEVRRQHGCGACYAFATIALFEWTYCKQTGKRVAFSEQYVVDCGRTVGMNGCVNGVFTLVSDFVAKYGLELRENYPYLAREDQCPYEADQIENNPEKAGYIRIGEQNFRGIRIELVEIFLRQRPLVVNVAMNNLFHQYGGGVSELTDCIKTRIHSMLLIGSGREDGQEYWLFRNSHGPDWGEKGHYKLSKKTDCIFPKAGFMLVANSGFEFSRKQEK